MQRWQPLLQLLPHHAPIVVPLCWSFCSGRLGGLLWMVCRFFLPWHWLAEDRTVLGDSSQQLWAFLIHSRMFFPHQTRPWVWYLNGPGSPDPLVPQFSIFIYFLFTYLSTLPLLDHLWKKHCTRRNLSSVTSRLYGHKTTKGLVFFDHVVLATSNPSTSILSH